jgi:hypothetical protein
MCEKNRKQQNSRANYSSSLIVLNVIPFFNFKKSLRLKGWFFLCL